MHRKPMAMIPKAMRVLLGLLLLLGMFVVSATAADPLSGSGSQIPSGSAASNGTGSTNSTNTTAPARRILTPAEQYLASANIFYTAWGVFGALGLAALVMRIMEGRVDAEARQLADAVKVARSAVDIDIGNRFGKEKYVLEDD